MTLHEIERITHLQARELLKVKSGNEWLRCQLGHAHSVGLPNSRFQLVVFGADWDEVYDRWESRHKPPETAAEVLQRYHTPRER